jgi:hypothetical protein
VTEAIPAARAKIANTIGHPSPRAWTCGRLRLGPGAGPPRLELLPRVPGVEDQQVGADEQDDEPLDQQGQIARELGLEDRRIQVPLRRSGEQRAEQERGEPGADRGIAAEQRDCDAEKADLRERDRARCHAVLPAEHVHRAPESGEGAGDGHCQEVAPPDVDAAITRCVWAVADRAHLVAEGRAVEDERVHDQRDDPDEEADVGALKDPDAPEGRQLAARRHVGRS